MNRATSESRGRRQRRAALSIVSLSMAGVLLAGCADMGPRQRGTATGAGVGAAAGALIGAGNANAGKGALIGGAIGAVAGNLWSKRMQDKQQALERATQGTGIEVARTQDNQLKVNVPSDISFDTGRADIKPQLRPVLDQFAQGLDATTQVHIVGHTDATGSDAINNPLSVDRASSVREYLAARGVPPSRIGVEGVGSRQPVADNASDAGRARNRRVEIFLREPEQRG